MELGDVNISVKLTEIISNLVSVTPNTNFLSDIITFESALTRLLSSLSQTPGNELLIEQIISSLNQVKKLAINNENTSLCFVSIRWYVWIVFNKKTFDLSYLEIYDRAFFRSIQDIIDQNQTTVFKYLIQHLVDGIQINTHFKSIWTYYDLISNLNHRANINETLAYKYQSTEIKKIESLR